MSNLSIRVAFDTERSLAATSFTGAYQIIGSAFSVNPAILIFDNQTDVAVAISVDQTNVWKTFSPGEDLVLDLRANNGIAANYTLDIGTSFYTNASVGTTGSFRISNVYAR